MENFEISVLNLSDLPMYIVWYIQQFLDDIDRVIMSITTKEWFINRDYILRLNTMDKLNYQITFDKYNIFNLKRLENDLSSFHNILDENNYGQLDYVYKAPVVMKDPLTFVVERAEHLATIPRDTVNLIFGKKFNSKLRNIPNSVKHITLGDNFKYQISTGQLPLDLISLKFGYKFNAAFARGALPPKLEHLELGESFDMKFDKDVLPASLKVLKFGTYFSHKLDYLPENLETLQLGSFYTHELQFSHLINLKYFSLHRFNKKDSLNIGVLPPNVERVVFNCFSKKKPHNGHVEKPNDYYQMFRTLLPNSLISINYNSTKLEIRQVSDSHIYLLCPNSGGFLNITTFGTMLNSAKLIK